jgi:membrane protein
MIEKEPRSKDWRSVSTRSQDKASLELAAERAHEPGRGRHAKRPTQIPFQGWKDILWRVVWSLPQDRVLATAGGVAFFGLVAVFPGLAAVVSIYGLFSDPSAIGKHLSLLSSILPAGVIELLVDQLTAVIHKSAGVLSTASLLS